VLIGIAAASTWPLAVLLFSQLPRNIGQYTVSDVIAFRMRQRPVRAATATATLVVSLVYLICQMAAAGSMMALLLNVQTRLGQLLIVSAVGLVMVTYVLVGGMRGTTYVQIIKAVLMLGATALMTVFLLGRFGFDFSALLGEAIERSAAGSRVTEPGLLFQGSGMGGLDLMSAFFGVLLGGATMPHVMMRYFAVPSGKQARKSAAWATFSICSFYMMLLVLGYGAVALVGGDTIRNAPGGENSALPLLAYEIGGPVLIGIICAIAFAATLAVVAGLTLTASATFAQDVYGAVFKRGEADGRSMIRVARTVAVLIGVLAVAGGTLAINQDAALLAIIALSLGAAVNVAPILYSIYWRRFNTAGALWSIWGGLVTGVALVALSPTVSGDPDSWLPQFDFALVPIRNPAIIAVPVSVLLGYLGTVLSRDDESGSYAELEVRSLTGIGAS
jgi:cation/acetate symporter